MELDRRCPFCFKEIGDASICPKCGTSIPKNASDVQKPGDALDRHRRGRSHYDHDANGCHANAMRALEGD